MFYLLLLVPAFIPALIFAGSFCGFKDPTLDFALQPICNSAIFPPLRESTVFHALINFGCTVANHVADIRQPESSFCLYFFSKFKVRL